MGIYVNPGNISFQQIRNDIYVDKTGLIDYVNRTIDTSRRMTCFSRPRRFGKSFAAKMLCSYYSKNCDSRELFKDLEISHRKSFGKYMNQLNVLYLDITRFISSAEKVEDIVSDIHNCVIKELKRAFPGQVETNENYLPDALGQVTQASGERFFIIIDEWDALFREAKENIAVQKDYIQFLRGLFKGGTATDLTIAGAYMTGILPIKKYGTESALTNFIEFTMLKPGELAEYIGFTEDEVENLCETYGLDFETAKNWYDGYAFNKVQHVYSPNSVMNAIYFGEFGNYWTESETYESLQRYISLNFDGLKDAIILMLGGERVFMKTSSFQNDVTTFHKKDDVLTLLVHLGYLAYDERTSEVYIPNLEITDAFGTAVGGTDWKEVNTSLDNSEKLLRETISGNCSAVAEALELAHENYTSILAYNDENSLCCTITLAYYTARNDYEIIRELPAGKGFADMAFIPHRNTDKPAMIVELKYDRSADSALRQIKEKRYAGRLKDYAGEVLLVGINYDVKTKKHECKIERMG